MKRIPTFLELDENLESELFLNDNYIYNSQKRVYIKRHDSDEKTEKIINLSSIQSVSANEVKKKRSIAALIWGIIILAAAAVFFVLRWQLAAYLVGGVGVALTVLGVFLCLPRYFLRLEIVSNGYPIELSFKKIKGHQEKQLKNMAFGLLVKRPEYAYAQPEMQTMFAEQEASEVQVQEVSEVQEAPAQQDGGEAQPQAETV